MEVNSSNDENTIPSECRYSSDSSHISSIELNNSSYKSNMLSTILSHNVNSNSYSRLYNHVLSDMSDKESKSITPIETENLSYDNSNYLSEDNNNNAIYNPLSTKYGLSIEIDSPTHSPMSSSLNSPVSSPSNRYHNHSSSKSSTDIVYNPLSLGTNSHDSHSHVKHKNNLTETVEHLEPVEHIEPSNNICDSTIYNIQAIFLIIYSDYKSNPPKYYVWSFVALCIIIIVILFYVFLWIPIISMNYYEKLLPEPDFSQYKHVIDFTFFGDSLVARPFHLFNMYAKIRTKLELNSTTTMRFHNTGSNGVTIARIRADLPIDLTQYKSQAGLLYWDSDFDVLDETKLSPSEVNTIQSNYENDLRYVIRTAIANGTYIVTVCSPGLKGEGPYFIPQTPIKDYENRNKLLDKYTKINENIAVEMNVSFSNVRSAFKAVIPFWWKLNRWYVTLDGEHSNKRGTDILVNIFSTEINNWLRSRGYSKTESNL